MSKRVLITGATSGIGYEFAEIFANMGYNLTIASRNANKMEQLKRKLNTKYNVDIDYIAVDLSSSTGASTLYQAVKQRGYGIDVLVNNSGVGVYGDIVKIEEKAVLEMLQLNILSLTELTMKFIKDMKENGSGYILNVASVGAYQPLPYMASYGASKSYVLNFSEAIAKEAGDFGVTVCCLCPGPTETDFFNVANAEKGLTVFKARMNAKRVAQIGVDALFSRKISVVPGIRNFLLGSMYRIFSRNIVVSISKKVLSK